MYPEADNEYLAQWARKLEETITAAAAKNPEKYVSRRGLAACKRTLKSVRAELKRRGAK